MTLTQDWTPDHYLKHITDNNLDNIWTSWSNPKSTGGIRLNAYKPIYPVNGNVEILDRKCTKKGCNGIKTVPQSDRERCIINNLICNVCGSKDRIIYRWLSARDKRKLTFSSPDVVKEYGLKGRAFYSTLNIYEKEIIPHGTMYNNEKLYKAATLGIDIDIKNGTILDTINREDLQETIEYIRSNLDTVAPESYNLQTSGNGVYILMHHDLCTMDINSMMGEFNGWLEHMKDGLKKLGVTKTQVDTLNMPSRVFKLMGSIHQTYDLVSIPLEYDVDLTKMSGEEFKLKNFDINNYIVDEKLKYYKRFNTNERMSLYKFLEEHSIMADSSGFRALRYNYTDAIESITGETQQKDTHKMTENEFENYYKSLKWNKLNLNITGRVYYRETADNQIVTQTFGVNDEDEDMIHNKILETLKVE